MPISQKEYERKPARFWAGKKVKSLCMIKNGWAELPAGTVFKIRGKMKGFDLVSDPCKTCGLKVSISRVGPEELELMDD